MFAKVTRHLISETDPDGSLIAVSRLTDSDKLQPLAVVLKSPRRWPWQRPKYRPTDFTLAQVTCGRKTLKPVVVKSDFLNYESTYAGTLGGTLSAEMGVANVKAEGKRSSKVQSSLGRLFKEVVDINRLMKDSKDRLVDLEHPQVQQSLCKRKVMTVLQQRILTSDSCCLRYHGLGAGSCGGVLSLLRALPLKLSVSDSSMDSDVSMEIPANTVLAYSIMELRIKRDGQYEFCFQDDVSGGFDCDLKDTLEEDGGDVCETDGGLNGTNLLLSSNNSVELSDLKAELAALSKLDAESRSSLLSVFESSLLDQHRDLSLDFLILLEDWLDDWCSGEVADVSDCNDVQGLQTIFNVLRSLPNSQHTAPQQPATAVNGKHEGGSSLGSANQTSAPDDGQLDALLVGRALHLLVSASLELTSDCLHLIQSFYSDGLLSPLSQIMAPLLCSQPVPLDSVPAPLQSEAASGRVQALFSSAGLQLATHTDSLLLEPNDAAGVQPVTMGVVVQGLANLMSGDV